MMLLSLSIVALSMQLVTVFSANNKLPINKKTAISSGANSNTNLSKGTVKLINTLKYYKVEADRAQTIATLIDQLTVKSSKLTEVATDFLNPTEIAAVKETLQKEQVAVSAYLLGGFPQAQRKRIVLQKSRGGQNRNYYEEDTDSDGSEDASNNFVDLDESPEVCLATSDAEDSGIAADNYIAAMVMKAQLPADKSRLLKDSVSSAVNAAVFSDNRYQIGDLLMAQAVAMEKKKASAPGELSICAFVMVAPELCDDLRRGLKRVDDVPVSLERIALSELPEPVISEKELTIVENSLRLDALASGAFGISRSRVVKLISNREISVDQQVSTNSAATLQVGQLVSVKMKGQFTVLDIDSTSKGKYRIKVKKSNIDAR